MILRLVRKHLLDAKPYSSARDEYSGREGLFLDANENPNDHRRKWNRYPDPYQVELKQVISELKGVNPQQIFIGLGSDEPIELLIRAFCEPGQDKILICPPTYGMYKVSADIHNVEVQEVPFQPGFKLDIENIKSVMEPTTKIVFLCSPNNPSGNALDLADIIEVANAAPGLIVVDEAYIDFSSRPSLISELSKFPNLVVLQTLSKAWGLAAIRLGLAFAHQELVNVLNRIKPPYNIPGPIQEIALETLRNGKGQMLEEVKSIVEERGKLAAKLKALPMVERIHSSETNFLLVKFQDAVAIFQYLLDNKVIVRDRSSQPLCQGCLRFTVGTPAENDRLFQLLESFDSEPSSKRA